MKFGNEFSIKFSINMKQKTMFFGEKNHLGNSKETSVAK